MTADVSKPIRLALVGIGKIARSQHLPAIDRVGRLDLTAMVSTGAVDDDVRFETLSDLVASGLAIDAVSFATPPVGRFELAVEALAAGWHVMLEKPPTATVSELEELRRVAGEKGRTVFAAWHSHEAAGVGAARQWLADRRILGGEVFWHENVRDFHPGQEWIFAPGGLGVFDPAINALSILTEILPCSLFVEEASLVFPANRHAPIRSRGAFATSQAEARIAFDLDFESAGEAQWDIAIRTDRGVLELRNGGADLYIEGVKQAVARTSEYEALYERFVGLVERGESDVDGRPLQLVADIFLTGGRETCEPFAF
ncbi:Gfo/Idh/MocA family oxidoreductase [Qipengyuania pelagi]|uniref:Gfo/Idh/MocA family oxidoreductase n=1 Tax=Qipengyuania pelagi TaxID=994320 RepID=A0A844Y8J3_9SPHN|nr:gfo/Idh/MocA family oxidoreductase [Qipengyuania pelagi]